MEKIKELILFDYDNNETKDEEAAYQSAVEDAEFLIDCTPTVIESEEGEGE